MGRVKPGRSACLRLRKRASNFADACPIFAPGQTLRLYDPSLASNFMAFRICLTDRRDICVHQDGVDFDQPIQRCRGSAAYWEPWRRHACRTTVPHVTLCKHHSKTASRELDCDSKGLVPVGVNAFLQRCPAVRLLRI